MDKAERGERNLRIVLARVREVPVKTVAAQYEISERQVRRIIRGGWTNSEGTPRPFMEERAGLQASDCGADA